MGVSEKNITTPVFLVLLQQVYALDGRAKTGVFHMLCHADVVTYNSGHRGDGRVPVLRDQWHEPLRAIRDPLARQPPRGEANVGRRSQRGTQTRLGRFVSTYGWRAYAVPALVALTGVVVYQTFVGTITPAADYGADGVGLNAVGASGTSVLGAPPRGMAEFDAQLPTGILPDGGSFTQAGLKTWHIVEGAVPQVGQGSVTTFRYTVEVEDGVDTSAYGGDEGFARMVTETLSNPKSWIHDPRFAFIRIDDTGADVSPDFRVSLTSPRTVREGCGYEIELESSCYTPVYGGDQQPRVLINEARWVRGAVPFQGDVGSYRQYVINHEVGHAIGYDYHEPCGQDGGLAPIMMQQTFSTSDDDVAVFDPDYVEADGKTCRFNPWPYPIA